MKTLKILLLFTLFVSAISCKKEDPLPEPTGVFSLKATNEDLRAPAEITFTPSDNIDGAVYLWDFGDGTTTTEKNPKKVYTTGGPKNVRLSVTANGKSKTESQTVTIGQPFTKLRITKSTIMTAAPAYPDGTAWDIATGTTDIYRIGGPDVYLIARYEGLTTGENYTTTIKTNVTATQLSNGSLFWEHTAPGVLITSKAKDEPNLLIQLRDADVNGNIWTSTHEGMGYTNLKISDLMQISNKYPTSVELKGFSSTSLSASQKYLNDGLKIKLDLKWEE